MEFKYHTHSAEEITTAVYIEDAQGKWDSIKAEYAKLSNVVAEKCTKYIELMAFLDSISSEQASLKPNMPLYKIYTEFVTMKKDLDDLDPTLEDLKKTRLIANY